MSNDTKEHLKMLARRISHLQRRIKESPKDLSWDRSEVSALRWAITRAESADEYEEAVVALWCCNEDFCDECPWGEWADEHDSDECCELRFQALAEKVKKGGNSNGNHT